MKEVNLLLQSPRYLLKVQKISKDLIVVGACSDQDNEDFMNSVKVNYSGLVDTV